MIRLATLATALLIVSCSKAPDDTWHALADSLKAQPEAVKVERANDWWNTHLTYRTDADLYGTDDYWATPRESLSRGAGDCEDYVAGKWSTLLRAGIASDSMRWAEVYAAQRVEGRWTAQPHMVLLYGPQALVLDSLRPDILPLSQRTDLAVVATFNASGAWGRDGHPAAPPPKWTAFMARVKGQA